MDAVPKLPLPKTQTLAIMEHVYAVFPTHFQFSQLILIRFSGYVTNPEKLMNSFCSPFIKLFQFTKARIKAVWPLRGCMNKSEAVKEGQSFKAILMDRAWPWQCTTRTGKF